MIKDLIENTGRLGISRVGTLCQLTERSQSVSLTVCPNYQLRSGVTISAKKCAVLDRWEVVFRHYLNSLHFLLTGHNMHDCDTFGMKTSFWIPRSSVASKSMM